MQIKLQAWKDYENLMHKVSSGLNLKSTTKYIYILGQRTQSILITETLHVSKCQCFLFNFYILKCACVCLQVSEFAVDCTNALCSLSELMLNTVQLHVD